SNNCYFLGRRSGAGVGLSCSCIRTDTYLWVGGTDTASRNVKPSNLHSDVGTSSPLFRHSEDASLVSRSSSGPNLLCLK
ncbi:hypothetical protein KUCAC02_000881, partial [Chaenocephalus aceratus]